MVGQSDRDGPREAERLADRADRRAALSTTRVGRLLRAARRRRGLSLRRAALITGVSREAIAAYERGAPLPDEHLAIFGHQYGGSIAGLVPLRGPRRGGNLGGSDAVQIAAPRAGDEVLGDYLALITELRRTRRHAGMPLRDADLEALAVALGSDASDVESRLVALLDCTPEEARFLHSELSRRRLLVPGMVAGAAFAGIALGAPLLGGTVRTSGRPEAPAVAEASETASTSAVPESPTTAAAPAPAEVADPPEPAAAGTSEPPAPGAAERPAAATVAPDEPADPVEPEEPEEPVATEADEAQPEPVAADPVGAEPTVGVGSAAVAGVATSPDAGTEPRPEAGSPAGTEADPPVSVPAGEVFVEIGEAAVLGD